MQRLTLEELCERAEEYERSVRITSGIDFLRATSRGSSPRTRAINPMARRGSGRREKPSWSSRRWS